MNRYILASDGVTPVPCTDLLTWGRWFESKEARLVAFDQVGDVDVSTVFLGLDHSFGNGPPVLWETMIFGGEHDGEQWRYTSHADAVKGHAHALSLTTDAITKAEPR